MSDQAIKCIACGQPMQIGQAYYPDESGGEVHADCIGPERESYTYEGEPLKPDQPIPPPHVWTEQDAAASVPAGGADDIVRTIAGEYVCGFRVAAYRETHPEHGDKYGHTYSEHWSTPSYRNPAVKVERLFTEEQLREALARAVGDDACEHECPFRDHQREQASKVTEKVIEREECSACRDTGAEGCGVCNETGCALPIRHDARDGASHTDIEP